DEEEVGPADGVAAGEVVADERRVRLAHHGADVERVAAVEDAHLGALRGGCALGRLELDEVGRHVRRLPGVLAEHAVHADAGGRRGEEDARLGRVVGLAGRGGRSRREGEGEGGEEVATGHSLCGVRTQGASRTEGAPVMLREDAKFLTSEALPRCKTKNPIATSHSGRRRGPSRPRRRAPGSSARPSRWPTRRRRWGTSTPSAAASTPPPTTSGPTASPRTAPPSATVTTASRVGRAAFRSSRRSRAAGSPTCSWS